MAYKQIPCYVTIVSDDTGIDLKSFIRLMKEVSNDLNSHKKQMLESNIELLYYLAIWDSKSEMLPILGEYQNHIEANKDSRVRLSFHKIDDHIKEIASGSALMSVYHATDGTYSELKRNILALEPLYRYVPIELSRVTNEKKFDNIMSKRKGRIIKRTTKGIKDIT